MRNKRKFNLWHFATVCMSNIWDCFTTLWKCPVHAHQYGKRNGGVTSRVSFKVYFYGFWSISNHLKCSNCNGNTSWYMQASLTRNLVYRNYVILRLYWNLYPAYIIVWKIPNLMSETSEYYACTTLLYDIMETQIINQLVIYKK